MKKFSKAIGTLLGLVTGGVVLAICGAIGWDIDPGLAVTIAGALGTLGTILAPKNSVA